MRSVILWSALGMLLFSLAVFGFIGWIGSAIVGGAGAGIGAAAAGGCSSSPGAICVGPFTSRGLTAAAIGLIGAVVGGGVGAAIPGSTVVYRAQGKP